MSAYFFVDILEITDEAKLEEYRATVFKVVEQYGGTYRVLGGQYQVAEGDWTPNFPVIIEFPSLEQAKKWYDSDEYKPLKELRIAGTRGNAVFFEGLA